ncbi:hypothetical protein VZC37_15935 [Gordonia sp. LSe1-13]|uniref:Secreted protein n=1 Tax=Gordonia sesuvii TaxID=3116777 RepID=A0ABU7MFF0_9ACTN|nr:hypothetical protein [Gordonia sp. LSe1-13]
MKLGQSRLGPTMAAVAVVAGGVIVLQDVPGATASPPRIGAPCTKAEARDYRNQPNGVPTVCAYMGGSGGFKWVRVAPADPVTRTLGQPCSGQYSVAVTPKGKAVMCAQGRWSVGP